MDILDEMNFLGRKLKQAMLNSFLNKMQFFVEFVKNIFEIVIQKVA